MVFIAANISVYKLRYEPGVVFRQENGVHASSGSPECAGSMQCLEE